MKVKTRESVRDSMKSYVDTISANCREIVGETERLANFVEDLLQHRDQYDTSTASIDERIPV